MRQGNELLVEVKASNSLTGTLADQSTVICKAYAPSKDPQGDVDDRADPDATAELTWDTSRLAFYGSFVDTADWVLGVWTLLVEVEGEITGHAWKTETVTAY
jgi:hypothetical protein